MRKEKARLRSALDDPDVARWHANLAERSELTADIYARRLDRFCEEFKTTYKTLWGLDSKSAYNFLVDAVREYRGRRLTSSTIKGYLKPVISWLRENDIILTKSVNISGTGKTPTLEDEKSPEPYELQSVWRFCNPREAALIALEAFTGCRPQVFGNYRGNDGLRLFDLPELKVNSEAKKIEFRSVPARVVVREEVSKERNQYETFLCEEGCTRLAAYLERRMQLGEVLRPDSAVIADDEGEGRTLTTKSMYEIVKTPFRHAGLPWRPYILRRYADVRLGQAAAKPEMALLESWVTFWMGHHGDIESVYRHKKKLSDSQLEQMREAYARASEMLQTTKLHKQNGTQIRREIRSAALTAVGYSDDEIKQLDLDRLTTDEFSEALRKRLVPKKSSETDQGSRYMVVKASELRNYVNGGGWKPKERVGETEWLIELLLGDPKPSQEQ
jgi:hypothetical protein